MTRHMKSKLFSVMLALTLALPLAAQADPQEWRCLSALQLALTGGDCEGTTHVVGGGTQPSREGTFACGFVRCQGQSADSGANYYAFRDHYRFGMALPAPLCFHMDGTTRAYRELRGKEVVSLTGFDRAVAPASGRGSCKVASPFPLFVNQSLKGAIHSVIPVAATSSSIELEETEVRGVTSPQTDRDFCDTSVRRKIVVAARALGEKLRNQPEKISGQGFVDANQLCKGLASAGALFEALDQIARDARKSRR